MTRTIATGLRLLLLAPPLALGLAACDAMRANTQGPVQPQATSGPCQVDRFFLLGLRSVPTTMTVANTGAACRFTLINPALNAVVDAALLTGLPRHGEAHADLISGNRQAEIIYTPVPGYTGPDTFSVTLEPGAVGVTVKVVVQPPR